MQHSSEAPKRPIRSPYAMVTHRGQSNQPKIFWGLVTRPQRKQNTGGGRPPKRLFLGLGSRPAASLRSPDAPAHSPTTPRTPTSRASVKGRDYTVVMEPDIAKSTLRLRPCDCDRTTRSTPSPTAAPNNAMVPVGIAGTGRTRTPHNP